MFQTPPPVLVVVVVLLLYCGALRKKSNGSLLVSYSHDPHNQGGALDMAPGGAGAPSGRADLGELAK